ncbi:MAG: dihydrodipicolinate synthase family protein, partial [Kiritimatiellota bacterium]|nr:dihydrodipicolinate synthase family protein [Kiritimatiellota bacterium]
MKTVNLKGIIPAVIVPMRADHSIDFDAFRRYLEWIISLKPVGLAVNVDTGEGPYLTSDERIQVIQIAREAAGARCAIIAGVGGPGTLTAIANAKAARQAGADGLLV